jgi:hypothetical protein
MYSGERQKNNLKNLQDLALASHNFATGPENRAGRSVEAGMGFGNDSSPDPPEPSVTSSELLALSKIDSLQRLFATAGNSPSSCLGIVQQSQLLPLPESPLTPESVYKQTVIGQTLDQEGAILDEKTRIQILEGKVTLQSILQAGLRALSLEGSATCPETRAHSNDREDGEELALNDKTLRTDKILVLRNAYSQHAPSMPDVHTNHIRMKPLLYVAACIANASILGFSLSQESCEDLKSPFFRGSTSESAAKVACLNDFSALSPDLRPSATQLVHRHHPYIDVLPFPTLRERIIKLAYVEEEPMIDEDELCQDLNDGLVCWGSVLDGRNSAMGSGAPWDVRSWEAQPWFLKKWWIVIGGAEGEIYKQTQWWRQMRGERSC